MVRKGQTRLMQETLLRGRGDTQVKECGVEANAATKTGMTAVMWSAEYGHTKTVVELVRMVVARVCGGWRIVGSMLLSCLAPIGARQADVATVHGMMTHSEVVFGGQDGC